MQAILFIIISVGVITCACAVARTVREDKAHDEYVYTHARSMGKVALYEARMRGCGDAPYGVLFDGVKVDTMEALVEGMRHG